MRMRPPTLSGATILEAALAGALLALSLSGLFALCGQSLKVMRANSQQAAATFCLQQRIEAVRTLSWSKVSDAAYLRDNVLNSAPISAATLTGCSEQITVDSYPTGAATPTIVLRSASGSAFVQQDGALSGAKMLRIRAQISWPGAAGSNSREFTTVMTQGGILR